MRRLIPVLLALLVIAPAAWAGEPPKDKGKADQKATPAEQYQSLLQDYNKHLTDFFKEYNKAKTDEEKQKLVQEKYPNPAKYAKKFLKLAEEHPNTSAAADALAWIVTKVRFGPDNDKAVSLLLQNHIKSDRLGSVALMMGYSPSPANEKALRRIIQENPHHDVQGKANYALGQILKNEKKQKAAEQEFETVAAKYADVKMGKRTLADLANGELFEIRNLAIGKVAPNIVGTDADSKKFQLTDYRGKVVVLDFWGFW